MAKQIENRVVEMEFKNKDFEKAIAVTLESIDELNKKLDSLNKVNVQGFDNITKAANRVDFSALLSGVENLETRFTTITGKIKSQLQDWVIEDIIKKPLAALEKTADTVFSTIVEKGKARSQNLSQAKFQLEALGVTWEQVYKDMDFAVSGTAYGMDEAAMAASQFAASNVKLGDSAGGMARSLRAISGVAAMTGRGYTEIAQIFTTVAGTGRAMNGELNRIAERGLNAKKAIADYLNSLDNAAHVTQNDVEEMARKGQISFEIFSEAMMTAFGEHAAKANDLFTGALANTKAALGRIGERFATPLYENLRQILVALIPVINDFKNSLDPVVSAVERLAGGIKDLAVKALNDIHGSFDKESKTLINWFGTEIDAQEKLLELINAVAETIDGISIAFEGGLASSVGQSFINVLYNIVSLIGAIKGGFEDVFGEIDGTVISRIASKIEKITEKLKMTDKTAADLRNIAGGIYAAADMVFKTLDAVWNIILVPMLSAISPTLGEIISATGSLGEFLVELDKEYNPFAPMFNEIQKINAHLLPAKESFDKMIDSVKKFVSELTGVTDVESFFNKLNELASDLHITDIFMGIAGAIAWAFENLTKFMQALTGNNEFNEYIKTLTEQNKVLTWIRDTFTKIKTTIHDLATGNKTLSQVLGLDELKKKFTWINTIIETFKEHYKSIFEAYEGEEGAEGLPFIKQLGEHLKEQILALDFETIFGMIGAAFWGYWAKKKAEFDQKIAKAAVSIADGIQKVAQGITQPMRNMVDETDADRILKVAAAIALLAGSVLLLGKMGDKELSQALRALTLISVLLGAILATIGFIFRMTTEKVNKYNNVEKGIKTSGLNKASVFNPVALLVERIGQRYSSGTEEIKQTMVTLKDVGKIILAIGATILMIANGIAVLTKVIKGNESEFKMAAFTVGAIGGMLVVLVAVSAKMVKDLNKEADGIHSEEMSKQLNSIYKMILAFGIAMRMIMNGVAILAVVTKFTGFGAMATAIGAMIVTFAALVGSMFLMMKMLESFPKATPANMLAASGSMVLLALAMDMMIAPIVAITILCSKVNLSTLLKSMGVILGVMGVMTGIIIAFAAIGKMTSGAGIAAMLAGSASMALIAVAMNLMMAPIASITALAAVDPNSLYGALLTLGLLSVIMAAIVAVFGVVSGATGGLGAVGMVAGAVSMLVMAKALTAMLVPLAGIMALEKMAPSGDLGQVFKDLAIGLGILAAASVAAIVIAPLILAIVGTIMGLAASVMMVGIGVRSAGEGVLFFVSALALLQSIDFTTLADKIAQAITYMINGICNSLVTGQPMIVKGFMALITAGCSAFVSSTAMVAEAAIKLLTDVIIAIDNHAAELGFHLSHALVDILLYSLTGVVSALYDFINKLFGGSGGLSDALSEMLIGKSQNKSLGELIFSGLTKTSREEAEEAVEEPAKETADAYVETTANEMNSSQNQSLFSGEAGKLYKSIIPEAGDAGNEAGSIMGGESLLALSEKLGVSGGTSTEGEKYGQYFGGGYKKGIDDMIPDVKKSASNLVDAGSTTVAKEQKSASPSKVAMKLGSYFSEGYAEGMDSGVVAEVAKDQVDSMISIFSAGSRELDATGYGSISDSISSMIGAISESGDFDPTITPVLDLSNVNSGMASIDSFFAANRSMALAGEAAFFNETGRNLTMQIQNDNRNGTNNNISALGAKLDTLGEAIMNRQIVLDSGELVGGLVDPMDRSLGVRAVRAQRRG